MNIQRERLLTVCMLLITTGATMGFAHHCLSLYSVAPTKFAAVETLAFLTAVGFLICGNAGYHLARLGYLRRLQHHSDYGKITTLDFGVAPGLTILVPSYKEEAEVIRQTLLSAALQVYPDKHVVLLIDDPPDPTSVHDQSALRAARSIPEAVQAQLRPIARALEKAYEALLGRLAGGRPDVQAERRLLGQHHVTVAAWFEEQAEHYPCRNHADKAFVHSVFRSAAQEHRAEAERCRTLRQDGGRTEGSPDVTAWLEGEYRRLLSIFTVRLSTFERKQYANLSHDPNKAMNLNSYIGLMGRRLHVVRHSDGTMGLVETAGARYDLEFPDTPYIITLDADSILLRHYAETLIAWMERPEHSRAAVAQTPYSAYPCAPSLLERTAGATTDIQYAIHQGFTHYGATFWVGANALIRKAALHDIREATPNPLVSRYIQDRTVIEDTESTLELLSRGWELYNHPARLAYSATPSDFASLVIQRGRWANGGLLILPKLLPYWAQVKVEGRTLAQGLFQFHYLVSLALSPLCLLVLLLFPFSPELQSLWIPLAALPYCLLYTRDLFATGYQRPADFFRVYALNLLLVPVHLAGALKSLRQACTGHKIPFQRTPKITGRTRAPFSYLCWEYGFCGLCLAVGILYVASGRLHSAAFALVNAVALGYALLRFIGWHETWDDVRWAWQSSTENLSRTMQPGFFICFRHRLAWPRRFSITLIVLFVVLAWWSPTSTADDVRDKKRRLLPPATTELCGHPAAGDTDGICSP